MTTLRRALRQYSAHQGSDLAAAQTYYAVLAILPALVAVLAVLGIVSTGPAVIDSLLRVVREVGGASAYSTMRPILRGLSSSSATGPALVLGLAGSIWSASGYVGAVGRSLNRVYEVEEGRSWLRLKATTLLTTLLVVVLVTIGAAIAVLSGPVAASVGRSVGLGGTALLVWSIAKWPVLLLVVVALVGLLYRATPNVAEPRRRLLSTGAVLAVVVTVVASIAFGIYVAGFASYNATYGSLGGAVALLVWLWLVDVALVLGAELDAEKERQREVLAGLPAEHHILATPRVRAG